MKKIVAMLLVFTVLCSGIPSTQVQAASKAKTYKAYYNWLNKKSPSLYKKYKLVNLDGDKVPELVGCFKDKDFGVTYYVVCSYNGKKVTTEEFAGGAASSGGFRGGVSYIPGKGKILSTEWSSGTGEGDDTLYQLKKGKFKATILGTFKMGMSYKWKKKKVSEKVYYKKLKKVFNSSKAKSFDELKYISKSKMKKKLK